MTICFYFPNLKKALNNSLFYSMYSSFIDAIRKHSIAAFLTTEFEEIEGDILVLIIGGGYEPIAARAMHKFNGPVILYVHNTYITFYKSFLKRWSSRILFAYNPDFATLNFTKYASVGIHYYNIPFASDENIFFPVPFEKKYDIVFVGNADSGFGRNKYIDLLLNYAQKNNLEILLAGRGWEKYGFPFQIIAHGKLLNIIYNLSKICINIHNDRQYSGIDIEMDANNRLFDLAMAQCCQVVNGENMVTRYFDKNDIIVADDPVRWLNYIDYYLKNQEEREKIAKNARERALKDHTWDQRASDFVKAIEENRENYYKKNQKTGIFIKVLRYLDQYRMPTYRIKEIRIIRYLLIKFKIYARK